MKVIKVLTVGDGDLTLSLALARAYCKDDDNDDNDSDIIDSDNCSNDDYDDDDDDEHPNDHQEQQDHDDCSNCIKKRFRPSSPKLSLTASVLDENIEELQRKYNNGKIIDGRNDNDDNDDIINQTIKELLSRNVPILWGVDATQLHHRRRRIHCHCRLQSNNKLMKTTTKQQQEENNDEKCCFYDYDLTTFHHPHLGLDTLVVDEQEHANSHHRLLCHYLFSASQISKFVHVCLCGTQAKTWRLFEAANRTNLKLIQRLPTTIPFSKLWEEEEEKSNNINNIIEEEDEEEPNSCSNGRTETIITTTSTTTQQPKIPINKPKVEYAAPRRYRNGKLGSRHFLGKYGYRHRRTEGWRYGGHQKDMNVTGSEHFVFVKNEQQQQQEEVVVVGMTKSSSTTNTVSSLSSHNKYSCFVCGHSFDSQEELQNHMDSPAKPPSIIIEQKNAQQQGAEEQEDAKIIANNNNNKSQSQQKEELQPRRRRRTNVRNNKTASSSSTSSSSSPSIQQQHFNNPQQNVSTSSTTTTRSESKSRDIILQEVIVTEEFATKRLRWFLQHNMKGFSKRLAENSIRSGMVRINGCIVQDSSRIIDVGNIVSVASSSSSSSSNSSSSSSPQQQQQARTENDEFEISQQPVGLLVEILYRNDKYLAVWKPAGIRSKGLFPGTIEYQISKQEGGGGGNNIKYICLSSLETSCPGICVFIRGSQQKIDDNNNNNGKSGVDDNPRINNHNITHVMTALVHGHENGNTKQYFNDNDDWSTPINVSITIQSKWNNKRKKRRHNGETLLAKEEQDEGTHNICSRKETIQIIMKERMVVQHGGSRPSASAALASQNNRSGECAAKKVGESSSPSSPSPSPMMTTVLSTLSIKTKTPSTSSICQLLRSQQLKQQQQQQQQQQEEEDGTKEGHQGQQGVNITNNGARTNNTDGSSSLCFGPVVGDTYCRKEYISLLPRSIRNRIKGKLCIGCYEVILPNGDVIVKEPVPDKLSAKYWEKFLLSSS